MEREEIINTPCGPTLQDITSPITINGIEYFYSISKLKKGEGLKIKLFESKPKTNIYYEYEAATSELTNEIKFLLLCEDLDEMIIALKTAFNEGRAKYLEENQKCYIEFQFEAMGKSKKNKIEFKKLVQKDPITELKETITLMQTDYKNLAKEVEELKKIRNNDIDLKGKMKELLQDKEIKTKLYEEFEQIICSKFHLTSETKKEKKEESNTLTDIENTVKKIAKTEINKKVDEKKFNEKIKDIEDKINKKANEINKIKSSLDNLGNKYMSKSSFDSQIEENIKNNQLIKNISENLNSIKNNTNNDNYIEIKINIDNNKIGENIKIFQQSNLYKYLFNFEKNDIEVIVDGENTSIDIFERSKEFKEEEKSKDCYKAQKIEYNLETGYEYFLKFKNEGIHTIKIIFRRKLYDCSFLFNNCKNIIEIDLSNFDCSQVISCESMFDGCISLKKLNLGKLDFSLCKNIKNMFNACENLENLDVSHFNTKNSVTFEQMFCGCKKLKNIDVSKFDSSKCESINSMFRYCENLSETNMINWDMRNLKTRSIWNYGYFGATALAAPLFGLGPLGIGAAAALGYNPLFFIGNYSKDKEPKIKENSLNYLFYGCKNLKLIKMSCNFSNIDYLIYEDENNEIFKGLPSGGTFYWKKGINCDKLLSQLPVSWNRYTE